MKTFYTVRDIEDMHASGVVEIETHDDVVLTDVAREKAIALGMRFKAVEQTHAPTSSSKKSGVSVHATGSPSSPLQGHQAIKDMPSADMAIKVKKAVAARLGTDKYNDLLDKIIPQVMAKLKR